MKRKIAISILSSVMLLSLSLGLSTTFNTNAAVIPNNPNTTTYQGNYTDSEGTQGTRVTAKTSGGKATFEYWNWLSVDELANGLTFKMSPADYTVAEATNMKIIMEDLVDEKRQIIVTFAQGDNWYGIHSNYAHTSLADDVKFSNAYVNIEGTSQHCVGNSWLVGEEFYNSGQGAFNIGEFGSFDGFFVNPDMFTVTYSDGKVSLKNLEKEGDEFKVISDLKEAAYQANSTSKLDTKEHAELISRYTDEYVDNLFPSGMVRVKFEFGNAKSTEVSFIVNQMGGKPVSNVVDTTNPYIDVDFQWNAIVGKTYNMPTFNCFDNFSDTVSSTVSLIAPDESTSVLSDNSFTPTQEGEYKVVVNATDKLGNVNKKEISLTCFAVAPNDSFVKLSDEEVKNEYIVYETVTIPAYECRSNISKSQKLDTTVIVKKGGTVVLSESAAEDVTYTIPKSGEYEILYQASDIYGNIYSFEYHSFNAIDFPFISALADVCVNIGDLYIPNKVNALYKDNTYECAYEIFDAEGNKITLINGGFTPNEQADYTVKYSVTVDGLTAEATQTLIAGYLPSSWLAATEQIAYTLDYDMPFYAEQPGKGLYIKSSGTNTVKWENIIDLNKISAEDELLSFLPYSEDGCGISSFEIVLTDAHNAKKSLVIKINEATNAGPYAYVNISYDGRRLARSTERGGEVIDWADFGALIVYGGGKHKEGNFFKLRCNYSEKQFYIDEDWLLLDLDDGSQVGFGKEWEGFTTGEVYMEIRFVSNGAAGIIVSEIAGMQMSGNSVKDETAPNLYFTYPDSYTNNSGVLPVAVVGKEYPLVSASAYDTVFGDCQVEYTVYYNGENKNLYDVSKGSKFVPSKEGTYTYIISSTDKLGNKSSWSGEFTAYSTISAINVSLGDFDQNGVYAGTYFKSPAIIAQGGSGEVRYTVNITLNGKEVTIEDCGELYLEEVGELVYKIRAIDYLGTVLEKQITLNVVADAAPIIFVDSMPNAAIYGKQIVFPDFIAIDYSYPETESGYYAYKCIKVNGTTIYAAKGASTSGSLTYNVTAKDTLIVEYCAGMKASNITRVETFEIPVVEIKTNAEYIVPTNYDESCTNTEILVEATSYGIAYMAKGNKAFTVLNAVSSKRLELRFSGVVGNANQKYTDIVLTDYRNDRNSIILRIKNISGEYYLNINGNSARDVKLVGSMSNIESYITLEYSEENLCIVTGSGDELVIAKNVLGNEFKGFESGLVQVSFEIHDVSLGYGSVNIYQVGNQVFTESEGVRDIVGPQIWYKTKIESRTLVKGETLLVSKAYAQDVIYGESQVTVTIRGPKGIWNGVNNSPADKDYYVPIDEYGYYTITYTATDANGVRANERFICYSKDVIEPTLVINGAVPTKAKVGEAITLPEANVEDNYSECNLSVLVIAPNGSTTKLSEVYTYTAATKGIYYVVYYLVDADYNVTYQRFELEVK